MVKHATGFDKALAAHRLANLERVDARRPLSRAFRFGKRASRDRSSRGGAQS